MNAESRQQLFDAARRVLLARLPQVWAIYAYGSVARGDDFPDSDLDLAILLPPGQGLTDLLSLISELSLAVRREVDLVDLRKVGDILRREVLADGVALHIGNDAEVLAWEAQAMSRYAEHRTAISGILESFGQSIGQPR